MHALGFSVCLAVASALLAVWVDVRLDKRRPASPALRIGHAAAAYLILQGVVAATSGLDQAPMGERLAAIFGLVLPSLVYSFLAGVWLMRTLAEVARLARR